MYESIGNNVGMLLLFVIKVSCGVACGWGGGGGGVIEVGNGGVIEARWIEWRCRPFGCRWCWYCGYCGCGYCGINGGNVDSNDFIIDEMGGSVIWVWLWIAFGTVGEVEVVVLVVVVVVLFVVESKLLVITSINDMVYH